MTVNIEFPSDHHSECVFAFAFYFQHLWVFRQKQIMMEIRRDNFTIIKLKFRKQRKWTKQISFLFCRIESDKIRWPFIRGRQILRYLWSNTINIVFFGGFSSHSGICQPFGDVTITGEGLHMLTYTRHTWPLSSGGSFTQVNCAVASSDKVIVDSRTSDSLCRYHHRYSSKNILQKKKTKKRASIVNC